MLCQLSPCAVFFLFKPKTAYELRISDWSSDVCSSDLPRGDRRRGGTVGAVSEKRTPAERVTLGVSAMVLAAVVLLIAVQMPGEDEPPVPTARVDDVRRLGDQFHVVFDVTNTGDQTAANVQITGELNIRGAGSTGEQTGDFLEGGEHVHVTFVFGHDPDGGDLTEIGSAHV